MAERVFLAKDVDNNPFIGQKAAVLVRNENNEHAGNRESRSLKESRSHAAVHGDGGMETGTMAIKKELTAERTALMNEPASSTTPLERTPVEGQYGCSFCHQVFSEMNDLLDHQKQNHIKRETQGGNLVTDTALSSRGETPPDKPNQDNILDYTTQGMTTCNHENEHSSLDTAISSNLTGASQRTAEHADKDDVASDTDDIAKATGINHTSHADKDNVAKIHVSKESHASHADNDVVPATDKDDVIQLSGVKCASCTDKDDNARADDSSKTRHASLKDDVLKDGRHASCADEGDYGIASGTNHADDDNEATGTGANHALCGGKDDDVGEASEVNRTPERQQIMKQEFVSPIKFMLHRNAPVCSTLNESAQAQNNELSELGAIQSRVNLNFRSMFSGEDGQEDTGNFRRPYPVAIMSNAALAGADMNSKTCDTETRGFVTPGDELHSVGTDVPGGIQDSAMQDFVEYDFMEPFPVSCDMESKSTLVASYKDMANNRLDTTSQSSIEGEARKANGYVETKSKPDSIKLGRSDQQNTSNAADAKLRYPLRYPCFYCGKRFPRASARSDHERSHNENLQFKCSICGKGFNRKRSMLYHEMMHRFNPGKYWCRKCMLNFHTKEEKEKHLEQHVKIGPFSCQICDKSYKTYLSFKTHEMTHDGLTFNCQYCNKHFLSHSALNQHQNRVHGIDLSWRYRCIQCKLYFKTREEKKEHLLLHKDEKKFACSYCGKGFKSSNPLQDHERTHDVNIKFRCSHCPKRFTRRRHWLVHEEMHISDVGKQKQRDGGTASLDRSAMHSNFRCWRCKMVFHSKTEKQQHCKNHAVKALQQCTYCGKQFRYACHRREHEKNHTMDEKLNCLFCKSRFSKRVQLAAHIHQVAGSQLCQMKGLLNKKTKRRDVRKTRCCKGKVDQEESGKLSCGVCRKVVANKFHLRAHEVILHRLIKTGLEDSDAEDGTKSTKDGNCKMDTGDIGEEDEWSGGGRERSGGGYERSGGGYERSGGGRERSAGGHDRSGGGYERSEEDSSIRVGEIGRREEQSSIVKLEWQESMELSNEIGDDLNNDTGAIQNDDEASFPMHDTSIVNVMLVSICEFCDRTFRSEKGMLTHQKKKHKNTKEPYMCPDCPQTFAARAERDTHLLQHLSMRPYQCRFCPKRFKKAHHCREHELLHDVSSQIKCTYCEKGFTSNRYLLKHQLGTRSKTPLMCKICSKYFALKPCLMYHEKVCGKEDASSTTTSTCSSTASRPPDGAEVEEYGRQRSSEIHADAGWNDDSVSLAQRRRDKCRKPTLQPGDDVRFVKYLEGMIDVHLRKELDIQDDDEKGKSTEQHAEEQKDKVFKCKFCAVIFDTQVVLVKHEFLHTKKQDTVCWFCNLTFKTEELKTEHESSHVMNHLCQQCGTYFRSRTQMENHDCKNPHSKTEYTCERCIEKFSNPLDLLQHEGSHVGRRTYKCTTCKACFVNNDSFEYHMESEHGIVSVRGEKSRRRGFYSCRYCRKWFYKQSSLQMHEKGHTWEQAGMNLYTCFYCKDTFPNRMLLLKHEEDTHAAKRPYQCRLCGHRFISECKLQEHAIRHRESEYQCECCPRSFNHDFELFKHEKAHPDLKKYSCRSCDERFACDLNRMFHARRQHNATYPCPLCGQSLMTSSALARHLIEHKKKNQLPSKCHKFAEGRETSSPKSPVPKNLMSHPADSRLVRGPLDGSDNAPSVAEKRSNGLSSIESAGVYNAEVARLGNDCTGDVSDLNETKESGSNSSEYKRKLRTRYPSRNTTSQQDANEASTNHVGGRKDDQSESDEMFEIFRCKFCGKDFEDQKNCVHHEKLHSDKQWKCVTHMTSYITKEQMNHVEREHVGDREGDQSDSVDILELSACKFCGKNFEDEKNCFQHELLHSPEKQWKCESCMTSYFTKKLLMDHIQKEQHKTHVPVHVQSGRNEERQKAVCKIDFGDESVISIPDEGGEGDIKTDEGDNKSKSSLVNDESKPGGVIDKTNTKFKTKPSFDCIYCFRKFGSRIAYKKHKKSHGGPKPYRCRYCRDTFGQTKQRDKHETGHYKERPYKCGHCSWQFKRSWHRNDHEKIHIEAAQMKCEACTYRFRRPIDLWRHEKTHSEKGRHKCAKCSSHFINFRNLQYHWKLKHNAVVPSWKGRSSKKTTVHTKETTVHTKKTTVHTKKTTVHTKKTTVYAKKTSVHTKKVVNIRKKAAINTRKKVARRAKIDAKKRMTELSKRLERDDKLQNDNREKDLRAKIDAKKRMTELSKKLESSDKLQNDNRRNDLRAKIDANKRMTELSKTLESGDKLQNDNREKHFDNMKLGENVVLHYSDIQHECHLCYKRFESLNHIWKHEKVHTGVKRLKCHKCHSAFFNKGSLHYHLQTKHRASLQCAVNYPPVENTRELSQRIVIHYPETQLKCELCDEKFRILSQIWGHEKMHGGFKSHKCPKCIARFFNKGSVNYHLQKEHRAILERITALPPSENTQVASFQKLECGKCHKLFSNKNHLDEHKRLHDPNLQFRCEVCDKSFTRPIRLLRHEVIHRSGKKKYQCSHCQTGFFSQDSYDYHVKRHHTTGLSGKRTKKKKKYTALQQKQKVYECPHCSKTFGNAEVAKRHEASHSHLLRYGCTYPGCDVRCASQVLMEQHVLNMHHSDRPYQCSFCPKTFKTVGHFAYHEKRHQPEKLPYVCEVCNKGFVRPRAVFRHERSHAGEKQYKCLDCPLQCHNMVSMMYHKLSKHGITYRQQGLHKLKDTWKSKQNSPTVNANFVQQDKTKRTFLRRKGQLDVSPQKAGRIGVRKLNSFDDSNMTEADFTKCKVKDGNYDTGVANSEDQSPDVEEIAEDTGFICELCTEEFNSERELRRHKRFHSVEIKAMQSLFKHNDGATQEEYSGSVSNPIRRKAAVEDVASGKRGRGRPKGTFRSSKPRKPSIPGRGRGRPKGTFKTSKLKKSSLKTKNTRSKLILQRKRRAAFRRGITRLKTSQVKGEPDVKEKVAKMLKQLSWDTGVSSDTNPIVEERFRIRSPVKKDKLGQMEEEKKEEEKKAKEEVTILDDDDDDVVEIPIEKSPRVKKNIQNGHVFGKSPKRRKDGILFVRKEAKSKSPKYQKPSKFLSLLKETEREREDGMAFVSRLTPVLYNGYCRSCIQCGKRFDTDETLAEHQKWHTCSKRIRCLECNMWCDNEKAYRAHWKDHALHRLLYCKHCGKDFPDKELLWRHEKTHNKEGNGNGGGGGSNVSKKKMEDKTHTCDMCSEAFVTADELKVHQVSHTAPRAFVCEHCSMSFNQERQLRSHQTRHVGDLATWQKSFGCPLCGGMFRSSADLKAHEKTFHGFDGKFGCGFCDRTFGVEKNWRAHEDVHRLKKDKRKKKR